MNAWTRQSVELANTDCYLDRLFEVYSIEPSVPRDIESSVWNRVRTTFENNDDVGLINSLLDLELFPIKDPYIRYLKNDRSAIQRNPTTVKRIIAQIRSYRLDEIRSRCSVPKEANRQIGPLFNNWVRGGGLGIDVCNTIEEFSQSDRNRCFVGSDIQKRKFIAENLNHNLDKGFDLLAVYNKKFVLGEAKLITDFGGHQQTQFNDAMNMLSVGLDAIRIAILDGVIYIKRGNGAMQRKIKESNNLIMSSLVLKEFLETI